jgi:hypothetical protein
METSHIQRRKNPVYRCSNQFRRTPLVSSGASAASQNPHSYLATQAMSADTQDAMGSNSSMSTPARVNENTVLLTHHHDMMKDFGVQNVAAMTAVGKSMTQTGSCRNSSARDCLCDCSY